VETTALLSTLTTQATKLQDGLNQLADLQTTWNNTLASAQASNAPGPVLEQIDATRAAIAAAQAKIQTERSSVLDLQSRRAPSFDRRGDQRDRHRLSPPRHAACRRATGAWSKPSPHTSVDSTLRNRAHPYWTKVQ
jgi:X-X-X-Leu-X-X-Gly heptad repeat protein